MDSRFRDHDLNQILVLPRDLMEWLSPTLRQSPDPFARANAWQGAVRLRTLYDATVGRVR